ncbi:MAG: PilZ domain-containing protein [Candidatus Omnitrophica bacterium]|nr:PilZ domain-containing protein [Candidatus Omnitrophota bacterium]
MSGDRPSGASHSSAERRQHVRVDIFAVTRYFDTLLKQEVGVQTRIADISEGGVLMLTFSEGVPLHTNVRLSFRLPDAESTLISVEGTIRHTNRLERDLYRSGLQFSGVDAKNLKAIRKYISQHAK